MIQVLKGRIPLKALSVNRTLMPAYRGGHLSIIRSNEGREYDKACSFLVNVNMKIPKGYIPPKDGYFAVFVFGVTNNGSDADNLIKPFQDNVFECLNAKGLTVNDNKVVMGTYQKVKVPKGKEFIEVILIDIKEYVNYQNYVECLFSGYKAFDDAEQRAIEVHNLLKKYLNKVTF